VAYGEYADESTPYGIATVFVCDMLGAVYDPDALMPGVPGDPSRCTIPRSLESLPGGYFSVEYGNYSVFVITRRVEYANGLLELAKAGGGGRLVVMDDLHGNAEYIVSFLAKTGANRGLLEFLRLFDDGEYDELIEGGDDA
jgi:hypothetical protein